jgi:hypothetical protein
VPFKVYTGQWKVQPVTVERLMKQGAHLLGYTKHRMTQRIESRAPTPFGTPMNQSCSAWFTTEHQYAIHACGLSAAAAVNQFQTPARKLVNLTKPYTIHSVPLIVFITHSGQYNDALSRVTITFFRVESGAK